MPNRFRKPVPQTPAPQPKDTGESTPSGPFTTGYPFSPTEVVTDKKLGDQGTVAGFHRRSPERNHSVEIVTARGKLSLLESEAGFSHGELGADVDQVGIEGAHQVHAVLRAEGSRGGVVTPARGHADQE